MRVSTAAATSFSEVAWLKEEIETIIRKSIISEDFFILSFIKLDSNFLKYMKLKQVC
jgi:hypothetical protein